MAKRTSNTSNAFQDYNAILSKLERMQKTFSDKKIYPLAISSIKAVNDFCKKLGIEVKYQTNLAGDDKPVARIVTNGILVSVVSLPKKLILRILTKLHETNPERRKVPTPQQMLRELLRVNGIDKQGKFEIRTSGKITCIVPQSEELAVETFVQNI